MINSEVVFVVFGVEFVSAPQTRSVAIELVRQLAMKGIGNAYIRVLETSS